MWQATRVINVDPGSSRLWLEPVYPLAKIMFERVIRMYSRMDPNHETGWDTNKTDLVFVHPGGSRQYFRGSDRPDLIYGPDYADAVIDEASRCKEEAWHAVRSTTTATRGPIRCIGNVRGRKNWFYRLARKAEAGEPGMRYSRITADDAVEAGILDREEIESARRDLPDAVFRQLYMAEAADDEGNPFGIEAIGRCIAGLAEGKAVVYGWDLAKSIDWTVGIGLNARGQVCDFHRWQSDWDSTREQVTRISRGIPCVVDATGVGSPVVEDLQRAGLDCEGYTFTSKSKQLLMEGLRNAIHTQEISILDGTMRAELEAFEYEYTASGVRYCLDPDTRVLGADLRWYRACVLGVGDEVLAFDEYAPAGKKSRQWRKATVTSTSTIQRPCYEIVMGDGTVMVASQEHLWLVESAGVVCWRRTDQLQGRHPTSRSLRYAPTQIIKALEPWDELRSYSAGYLAAAFDGEGSIHQGEKHHGTGHNARLTFAQRENEMAANVRAYLEQHGYTWSETKPKNSVKSFGLTGRRHEFLRFLGQIRPERLLAKFDPNKLGAFTAMRTVPVETIQPVGARRVTAMGTSTKTLIAEGFASHNSAPDGMHDDCVCALALALYGKRTMWVRGEPSDFGGRIEQGTNGWHVGIPTHGNIPV